MSKEELDPEVYKEIWGEYPPQTAGVQPARRPNRPEANSVVERSVTDAKITREALLSVIEPHLMAIQTRLGEIESRLEVMEREIKEIGNRTMRSDGGSYGTQ